MILTKAAGTARPSNWDFYTMDLNADGTAAMRLNCNRGRGQRAAKAVGNGGEGSFRIGPPRNDARPVPAAIA
jgi:hypothetical protein